MAIEPASSAPQVEAQTPIEQLKADQAATMQENLYGNVHVEQQQQQRQQQVSNGEIDGFESQMSSVNLGELHVACAEGRLEDVRAVLSRGLENLETLDANTGCTPIVLAIRANHHDVVRELLSAGAIIPPPGLTNDPLMLSILYPQPMYGMPPQFMGMPPQEFYQQPGFYPTDGQQPRGMFMPPPPSGPAGSRKDGLLASPNGGNPNNLPPAEVSKTIPCRNFPNCKYGVSCVFFHPRQVQPFYPSGPAPAANFVPQGYENGYPAPYPPTPYFIPNNQAFVPSQVDQSQQQPASDIPQQQAQELQQQQQSESITDNTQHEQSIPQQQHQSHVPSAIAPVFVPGFQPQLPTELMSPPPSASQFGMSSISPSMLGTSLPSIPPAEAFFAAASPPPNGFMPPLPPVAINGPPNPGAAAAAAAAHARRQSFNQQQQFSKSFGGHGKKPSFSGAPKPWMNRQSATAPNGSSAKLGSWKDGNPPPCAFFNQGNCRNGEFCKFPHLDAEGNDSRHPDVVRGVLPPIPTFSRPPRGIRMMNGGPNDPSFRQQQQHQQQIQFLQHQRMAAAQAQQGINASASANATNGNANGETETGDKSESKPAVDGESPSTAEQQESTTAAIPTVNVEGETEASNQESSTALPTKAATSAAAPTPNIIRSASQPGVQRVHANGNNSRSHSPAPSNVSFHGNGHPRRAGSRVPPQVNGHGHGHFANNGPRSASNGAGERKGSSLNQRVPQAHEFPALGLGGANGTTTPPNEKKESNNASTWNGKTAAQVLSAPAPPKPEPVPQVKAVDTDGESEKSEKAGSVTMDSDSESDAVIISTKPSSAAQSGAVTPAQVSSTPAPASIPEIKKAPISFASAVGAAAALASIETPPVALKA
ncbi:uncharacterized protein L201_003513 [Kwoniella dendrophila CBS 6074]|uniref:C3H1-type domain-containing protein n=1 Tax=Kwoniella dendrophila CBS 6074 TaxID=1295534 RepID=A0AAX4JT71_9TREE